MNGSVAPAARAAATNAATPVGLLTWLRTHRCAPARCFSATRAGRRSTGGASGDSGTATGSPMPAATAASRTPSRANTWVTRARTLAPRPDPDAAPAAGYAEDPVDADGRHPGQLLLEHHPVAVPAGERRPDPAPGLHHLCGEQRGREVRAVGVLTDQQPVRHRRQDADDTAHRGGVEGRDGEVREDDGAARRTVEQHRRRRRPDRWIGPAHQWLVEEDAPVLGQLAPLVVPDASARAEHHPLRAAEPGGGRSGLHRGGLTDGGPGETRTVGRGKTWRVKRATVVSS